MQHYKQYFKQELKQYFTAVVWAPGTLKSGYSVRRKGESRLEVGQDRPVFPLPMGN